MDAITEKELTIIERLGNNGGAITQREIAEHTGFSLGLTNIILKRLTKKGYIKIRQLTPKKMHYILTRKGLAEKTKKSYRYIFRTIGEIRDINNRIQNLFQKEYQSGSKKIVIIGNNDLTEIIKLFSRDITDIEILWHNDNLPSEYFQGADLVIDCREENHIIKSSTVPKTINLIDYIAKGRLE